MKIAHISDIHWRNAIPGSAKNPKRKSRWMPAACRLFCDWVTQNNIELIIVSGDLVDVPFEHEELQSSEATILQDYTEIYNLFASTQIPILSVAGNHDHLTSYGKIFERRIYFELKDIQFVLFHDHQIKNNPFQREGIEYDNFIQALEQQNIKKQIHIQHYLIHPLRNSNFPFTYSNHETLSSKIEASNKVILSCSGHFHNGFGPETYRNCIYSVAPSFAHEPFPFFVYELSSQQLEGYYCFNILDLFPDFKNHNPFG